MNRKELLTDELKYIKSNRIKNNAEIMLELLPDYFFTIPASSTGKYHPNYALGEGGLVRHTKAAMKIANELLYNNSSITTFSDTEKDLILFILLIHDGLKLGFSKETYTRFDHPILISDYLEANKGKFEFDLNELNQIKSALKSHMGQWNKSDYQDLVLPLPESRMDKFVHLCDFLASRKFIEIVF